MADQASVFFVNGIPVPIVQELSNKVSSSDAQETDEVPAQLLRYCRPQDERPGLCLNEQPTENVLPVIDMSVLLQDSRREMSKLAAACRDWGFFQVVNHGIPLQLLGRMRQVSRTFFELPLAEKLKYSSEGKGISDGYGQAFVFSEEQPLDWADAFSLHLLPKDKRNLRLWPNSPPDFRETLDSYADRTEELIIRLMKLFAENLGLKPETRLIDEFSSRTLSMRMNYYPPCPRPDLALGLSPHTDGSIVTVLLQDDKTEGLQIKTRDHQWLTVKSIPEALVVNIGDSLEASKAVFHFSNDIKSFTYVHCYSVE
eukprot:TRINITY_DN1562_c0_g1_i2.p1 TRINITY_DN1562_c0_g1~~TRINITY_DN1562_c0_g1_i2.p1  ORF type:complete len:352 (-),score=37.45 TRINITY_DN1562_c0_g1_i2:713-1651(-)